MTRTGDLQAAQVRYGIQAGRRFWYGCASMVGRIGAKGVDSGREELRDV